MKLKLRSLTIGLIIGAALSSAVMAASTSTWYDVLTNGITIVIGGKN